MFRLAKSHGDVPGMQGLFNIQGDNNIMQSLAASGVELRLFWKEITIVMTVAANLAES